MDLIFHSEKQSYIGYILVFHYLNTRTTQLFTDYFHNISCIIQNRTPDLVMKNSPAVSPPPAVPLVALSEFH